MKKSDIISQQKLYTTALILGLITIGYNIIEGFVSVFFGIEDKTLALFGFGADSFVEVISGTAVVHMIIRLKKNSFDEIDSFEAKALKTTAIAFFLLAGGLLAGSAYNLINNIKPDTTFWGIVISFLSIITMYVLMHYKLKVGYELGSDPIISDANCTKACFLLSFVVLFSSSAYELFHIPYIDSIGSLGIVFFSLKEGAEALEKSKERSFCCSCED